MRIFQTGFSARLSFQKLFPVLVCRRRLKRVRGALWQHFVANGGNPLLLVTLSPAEVLGQETSKLRTPEQLHRIFYATRFLRRLENPMQLLGSAQFAGFLAEHFRRTECY